jgi:hypothetical protein
MITALIVHPEAQRLRHTCEDLRNQLAQLVFEYDQLRCVIVPNLAAEYQEKVGRYEYELFCAQVEGKRLQRTISLLQAAINRRQPVAHAEVEARLAAEFAAWQAQMQQMAAKVRAAGEFLANLMSEKESAELHRLYRALARRLHPDVNPGGSDYEKHLWQWASDAYRQGNLDDLRALAAMVGPADATLTLPPQNDVDILEQWRLYASDLRRRVGAQQERIDALEKQFPCTEREHLGDPAWVAGRRDQLLAELQVMYSAQKAYQEIVAQLWVSVAHE